MLREVSLMLILYIIPDVNPLTIQLLPQQLEPMDNRPVRSLTWTLIRFRGSLSVQLDNEHCKVSLIPPLPDTLTSYLIGDTPD